MKTITLIVVIGITLNLNAQNKHTPFNVLALYTAKHDQAHISFVADANTWFEKMANQNGFRYTASHDWNLLTSKDLSKYGVIVFLDTRPDSTSHRKAFEQYMKNGGAWMGFHFAGFALTPSAYPQDWNWYHEEFLAAGEYASNTWRPTSAILRVEDRSHPFAKGIPETFATNPNEWYRWKNDLTKNPDIKILASIDPKSFPLGTGPKQHEIWHSGYYPVIWTNTKYKMIYFNFGHNDIDYQGGTNKALSHTFGNEIQDKVVLNALMWLGSE
jgi:uncharacterized protein